MTRKIGIFAQIQNPEKIYILRNIHIDIDIYIYIGLYVFYCSIGGERTVYLNFYRSIYFWAIFGQNRVKNQKNAPVKTGFENFSDAYEWSRPKNIYF